MTAGGGDVLRVRWARGGEARVVAMDAQTQAVALRSTVPSPPGSRIEGALACDPPAAIRVKVHASKKQAEGDFLLEGRLIDLPRETRERIEGALRGQAAG